jgi:citrate lyase subunit beta/citryl-CoA lyase
MKVIRSFLFIPGDSDKKLGKADSTGADALILDLEDAVTPQNKPTARKLVPAFLRDRPKGTRKAEIWVRINAGHGTGAADWPPRSPPPDT